MTRDEAIHVLIGCASAWAENAEESLNLRIGPMHDDDTVLRAEVMERNPNATEFDVETAIAVRNVLHAISVLQKP